MDRQTTRTRGGNMAGYPFEIEILSIVCMNMMTRKYRLAIFFENCSNRLTGTKDHQVYFEVRTVLSLVSLR